MDYDVLILGGSLLGCGIAYELSKYSLNIALIERDYDIANDISPINAAVVFDGLENNQYEMGKLEEKGNILLDELTSKFNVPFKRIDSVIFSSDSNKENIIDKIYDKSVKRGLNNVELLDESQISKLKSCLNINRKKAVLSKNTAIISPYDLAISYGEIAFDNGVKFKLEERVIDIKKSSKGYKVVTNKNKFTCKMVINTTPNFYSIDADKENLLVSNNSKVIRHLLFEKNPNIMLNNIFMLVDNNITLVISPTLEGNTMLSIYGDEKDTFNNIMKIVSKITGNTDQRVIKNFYESNSYNDKISIDDSRIEKGYIKVIGKHHAQISMMPYIAKQICNTVIKNLNCKLNKDYNDKRREFYRFRDLSDDERMKLIRLNSKYGKIICQCNLVTEGEIIDSITRPLGARTVEGIKRRTGAAYGKCQGSYCIDKIISILARETNKSLTDIVKDSKDSKILLGRIKEFDDM